jgi:NhaA family Na+:H+ antiporter
VVTDLLQRLGGLQGEAPLRRELEAPLDRLERTLHPVVAFLIMPLFAFANAGVAIDLSVASTGVAVAVAAGLLLGKPFGIVLFSWLSVRLGLTQLPTGVNVKVLCGAGCLAGIGFTMSLFIAGLAFKAQPEHLNEAKLGVLAGSALSALLGSLLLWRFLPASASNAAAR